MAGCASGSAALLTARLILGILLLATASVKAMKCSHTGLCSIGKLAPFVGDIHDCEAGLTDSVLHIKLSCMGSTILKAAICSRPFLRRCTLCKLCCVPGLPACSYPVPCSPCLPHSPFSQELQGGGDHDGSDWGTHAAPAADSGQFCPLWVGVQGSGLCFSSMCRVLLVRSKPLLHQVGLGRM